MKPTKTAADYAAIGVAPLLIFLMISSLANFLTLTLYHGGFPGRISWILMMFTLGVVGIARIAIERDRAYSLGYAGILGLVTFVSMLRFVDSPLFVVLILALIAYLADIIVRDCTLIDETVDASGEGLIDTGRLFVKKQIEASPSSSVDREDERPGKKTVNRHQPGRTVLYLALAALPLFGLGQFFLRNDADTWDRAQRLLAFYLFASLSLLVTTSFLGLRRYLRQRSVDMPADVSIAWLFGGLAMIAAVLLVAYMAPMPGQALATFELPIQLDSPGNTQASRFGWGREGADKANPDAPRTIDPSKGKEELGQTYQQGAPQGDVGQGGRQQGPNGNQSGGNQSGGNQNGGKQQGSSASPSSGPSQATNSSKPSSKGNASQNNASQGNSSQPSSSGEQASKSSPSSTANQGPSQSSQTNQANTQSSASAKNRDQSDRSQEAGATSDAKSKRSQDTGESPPSDSSDGGEANGERDSQPSQQQESAEGGRQNNDQQTASSPAQSDRTAEQPNSAPSIVNQIPMITGMIKWLVILALAGVVVAFLWVNREAIRQWWESLLAPRKGAAEETLDEFLSASTQVPPRAFASFRNPIGRESDMRRVVVITFQAFEAWAREQGAERGRDETPSEFLRRAAQVAPQAAAPAGQIVDAYNRIVYGRGRPTQQDLRAAEQVWRVMQTT